MIRIDVPKAEGFNRVTNEFYEFPGATLILEHSLLSISKWESRWHKAFLTKQEKTNDELFDYIRCMIVNPNKHDLYNAVDYLTEKNLKDIDWYINDPMTATTFPKIPGNKNASSEAKTSELIYYLMIAYGIPFECQKWHISRLLTLIKVCERKNAPARKMNANEIAKMQSEQNAIRRKRLGTKG